MSVLEFLETVDTGKTRLNPTEVVTRTFFEMGHLYFDEIL